MAISHPEATINKDDVLNCIKNCLAKLNADTKKTQKILPPTPAAIPPVITEEMVVQLEAHLQSKQFDFKKIHSISCQKDDLKVELALAENESSIDIFQRVYVNRAREMDFKWANHLKTLWHSDCTFPVYIMAITYDQLTVKEEVVINCIKKCLSNIKDSI